MNILFQIYADGDEDPELTTVKDVDTLNKLEGLTVLEDDDMADDEDMYDDDDDDGESGYWYAEYDRRREKVSTYFICDLPTTLTDTSKSV